MIEEIRKFAAGMFRSVQSRPTIKLRKPIGITVAGAGMIAACHMKRLKEIEDVEIRSVCAGSLSSAKKAAEEFGIKSYFAGYEEALRLPLRGSEAVLIATPPDTHFEIAMAAISSGRHVLIEKPVALQPEHVDEIAMSARKAGLLAGSFASRFAISSLASHVREIVDSGEIGSIYRIEIISRTRQQRYGIEYNKRASWALSRKRAGGGALIDWGMYALALLDSAVGLPALHCIAAQTQRGLFPDDLNDDTVFDVEEAAYGLWRGDEGLLMSMDISWAEHAPHERSALILGLRGGLAVRWVPPFKLLLFSVDENGKALETPVELSSETYDADLAVIENFLASVDGTNTLSLPVSRDAELMRVLIDCYRLAGKGQA